MISDKDLARIEEERGGCARPAPATLAPSHLAQALDAFDDAGSPEAVLSPRRIWPLKPGDSSAAKWTLAGIIQRGFCCTATLFTAFAAEAFVNDFLAVHLKPHVTEKRFARIDRWSTTRKYIEGVEIAYGRLFWEDDEVMPALRQLFEVRNGLAHGRPGVGPPMAYMPDPSWRDTYPVHKVAEWLIAVAGAASGMERRCYGFDYESVPASAIWFGREIVRDHAAQANPLPDAARAGRPPLIQLLNDRVKQSAEAIGDLRLTVHELRDARLRLASDEGPWDAFTQMAERQAQQRDGEQG
jgi:hypothetical protein